MKTCRAALLALSALVIPMTSNADWIPGLAVGSTRIQGLTGDVTFTPTNLAVLAGCGSIDFYVVKSANNAKSVLAVLLAAQTSGKTVRIYVDSAHQCDTVSGRPAFTDVLLEP